METMFEGQPDFDGLEICEICWEDEGFHYGWCPSQKGEEYDEDIDSFNKTIDEEMMMLEGEDG